MSRPPDPWLVVLLLAAACALLAVNTLVTVVYDEPPVDVTVRVIPDTAPAQPKEPLET